MHVKCLHLFSSNQHHFWRPSKSFVCLAESPWTPTICVTQHREDKKIPKDAKEWQSGRRKEECGHVGDGGEAQVSHDLYFNAVQESGRQKNLSACMLKTEPTHTHTLTHLTAAL